MVKDMIKKFLLIVLIFTNIAFASTMCACDFPKKNNNELDIGEPPPSTSHTITFVVDGDVYYTTTTEGNCTLVLPDNPSKDGYEFDGWFLDLDRWEDMLVANYFENSAPNEDITAYAKFSIINNESNQNNNESETFIDNEIEYRALNETEYEIIGGNIDKLGETTYNVVSIADEAFMSNVSQNSIYPMELHGIRLPSSVKRIGDRAFYMAGLYSFIIPNDSQMEYIGDWAFYGNNHFEEPMVYRFPETLTHIGQWAFANDSQYYLPWLDLKLQQVVYLPSAMTFLGDNAFYGMRLCTLVNMSENLYSNGYYQSLVASENTKVYDKQWGTFRQIDDLLFFQNNLDLQYSLIYYGNSKKVVNENNLEIVTLTDFGFDYTIESYVFYSTIGVNKIDFQKDCRITAIKANAFALMEKGYGKPFSVGDSISGHHTQAPNYIFSTKTDFANIDLEFGWIYIGSYTWIHMAIVGTNRSDILDLVTILDNTLVTDNENEIQISTTYYEGDDITNTNIYSVRRDGWADNFIDDKH